jgi:hypothetical protein
MAEGEWDEYYKQVHQHHQHKVSVAAEEQEEAVNKNSRLLDLDYGLSPEKEQATKKVLSGLAKHNRIFTVLDLYLSVHHSGWERLKVPSELKTKLEEKLHRASLGGHIHALSIDKLASDTTLQQVILVTRHGARFPLGPQPGNLNWPSEEGFWSSFAGMLTPLGCQQHVNNGHEISAHYRDVGFLTGHECLAEEIYVRTTSKTRTVFSAISLLSGLFPHARLRFFFPKHEGEQDAFVPDLVHHNDAHLINLNIVQPDSSKDPFSGLHGNAKVYQEVSKKSIETNEQLLKFAEDPKILSLLEKLYKMTAFPGLDPSTPPIKRLEKFKRMYTDFDVDKVHNMRIFRNKDGLLLSEDEVAELHNIARQVWNTLFTGNTAEDQLKIAHAYPTGAKEILEKLRSRVNGSKQKFVYFSAHDTAIAALLSLFRLRNFNIVEFAAYFIIELHLINGEHQLRFIYNSDPSKNFLKDLVPGIGLPLVPTDINDIKTGGFISLEDFAKIVEIEADEGVIAKLNEPSKAGAGHLDKKDTE